ncbi:hypothetical protein V9K67_01330 [Paraflavisolibacter sp. H34]|uniref:hypothetical protein n=1 Tax=Huijunlia imazamoxiresistens TaxID=3127457 RepID=UPI003015E86A
MRKLIFSAIMVASSGALFAQKLDDVQEKISKGKFAEAQEKIDKIIEDPKGQKNAEAWYYRGIVYYNLGQDSTRTDKDYRQEAFSSLQKYYELDPKNLRGTLEQNVRVFQLYDAYYNSGIKAFNNKNFEASFKNFSQALNVENYIIGKGFSYPGINMSALDTNLILNTAAAASKANLRDSAMAYYRRLADAKLKGENYIEIYQILIDYYAKQNDAGNRAKYLAIAKELYPNNDYWFDVELAPLKDDKSKALAKYEELIAGNPNSYYLTYNYAVELFNYLYAGDKPPADAASFEPKVQAAIANSIKVNNTPEGNLLMTRYLTERIYKTEDSARAVRGTTPADVKKKQAITARQNALWDQMAPYAQAAFTAYASKPELKVADKGNIKYISNILIDYYNMKKQFDKSKEVETKVKSLGL